MHSRSKFLDRPAANTEIRVAVVRSESVLNGPIGPRRAEGGLIDIKRGGEKV